MKTLINFSLLALVMATSCTITKRVHQKGYSVQWNGHYGQQPKNVLHHDEVAETPSTNETEEIRDEFSSQENNETVNSENQVDGTSVEVEHTSKELRKEPTKNFDRNQFKSFKTIKTSYKAIANKAITQLKTPIHKATNEDPKASTTEGEKQAELSFTFGFIAIVFLVFTALFLLISFSIASKLILATILPILLLGVFMSAIFAIFFSNHSKKLGATDADSIKKQKFGKRVGKTILVIFIIALVIYGCIAILAVLGI